MVNRGRRIWRRSTCRDARQEPRLQTITRTLFRRLLSGREVAAFQGTLRPRRCGSASGQLRGARRQHLMRVFCFLPTRMSQQLSIGCEPFASVLLGLHRSARVHRSAVSGYRSVPVVFSEILVASIDRCSLCKNGIHLHSLKSNVSRSRSSVGGFKWQLLCERAAIRAVLNASAMAVSWLAFSVF